MPDKRFEGEFRTPALGVTETPIPISGAGHCTCSDEGLVIEGKALSQKRAVLFALAGCIGAAGGAFLLKLLVFPNMTESSIAIAAVLGLISAGMAPAKDAEGAATVTHVIPWDKIRKVKGDSEKQDLVIVSVKDHKPKGALHFAPQGDRDDFLVEIADRADIAIG